jgi:hypothetical protein
MDLELMEELTMTKEEIKSISWNLSNFIYQDNLEATSQLIELFNNIKVPHRPLNTPKDYVDMYDDSFYTYMTWEALVESELYQTDGLTEEECKAELGETIWQLPCGWYVQYV